MPRLTRSATFRCDATKRTAAPERRSCFSPSGGAAFSIVALANRERLRRYLDSSAFAVLRFTRSFGRRKDQNRSVSHPSGYLLSSPPPFTAPSRNRKNSHSEWINFPDHPSGWLVPMLGPDRRIRAQRFAPMWTISLFHAQFPGMTNETGLRRRIRCWFGRGSGTNSLTLETS